MNLISAVICNVTRIGLSTRTVPAILLVLAIAPVAMLSQSQSPGRNQTAAEAKVSDLVKLMPARTGPRPPAISHNKQAPRALTVTEKRNILREMLTSLRSQSRTASERNLALLPINWGAGSNVMSFSPPKILSAKPPSIDNVGSLLLIRPQYVDPDPQYNLVSWDPQGTVNHVLATYINGAPKTTYVLDYSVDADGKLDVDVSGTGGGDVQLEMTPTLGHLLVPIQSTPGGTFTVMISSAANGPWTLYSVHIQTAN
jgi:hypothetical protein